MIHCFDTVNIYASACSPVAAEIVFATVSAGGLKSCDNWSYYLQYLQLAATTL